MMKATESPLIDIVVAPFEEFSQRDVLTILENNGFIHDDLDTDGLHIAVANIVGEPIVTACGFLDTENNEFRLQFVVPLQNAFPSFDFIGAVSKHFNGAKIRYCVNYTIEEHYRQMFELLGFNLKCLTFISGEEECPDLVNQGAAKAFDDVTYLEKERLKTMLKFQSVYPDNDQRTVDYHRSIDEMFEQCEEFPNVGVVGFRDGKPVGFALIEAVGDSANYMLSFNTVFPGYENQGVLEDMVQRLTYNIQQFGCNIGVQIHPENKAAIERLPTLGYVPYTRDYER